MFTREEKVKVVSKLQLIDDNGNRIQCDTYSHCPTLMLTEFVFAGDPKKNEDGSYEILLCSKYTDSTAKLRYVNKE